METSLGELLQQMEKNMGVSIRVKWKHLETLGYSAEGTKVGPVRLGHVTNEKALRVILEEASGPYVGDPNELSYAVDDGEITISTKQDLSRMVTMPEVLHVRVYDTRDILRGWAWATRSFGGMGATALQTGVAANAGPNTTTGAGLGTTGTATGTEANAGLEEEPNNRLIAVIRTSVDPSSWDPSGPGRVTIWDDRLVVRQTAANHAAIADLINELRQAKETQVSLEARFISVSSGYLEKIETQLDFYLSFHSHQISDMSILQNSAVFTDAVTTGVESIAETVTYPALQTGVAAYLDDVQVTFLLEATQAHQDTRTLTAPA